MKQPSPSEVCAGREEVKTWASSILLICRFAAPTLRIRFDRDCPDLVESLIGRGALHEFRRPKNGGEGDLLLFFSVIVSSDRGLHGRVEEVREHLKTGRFCLSYVRSKDRARSVCIVQDKGTAGQKAVTEEGRFEFGGAQNVAADMGVSADEMLFEVSRFSGSRQAGEDDRFSHALASVAGCHAVERLAREHTPVRHRTGLGATSAHPGSYLHGPRNRSGTEGGRRIPPAAEPYTSRWQRCQGVHRNSLRHIGSAVWRLA